VYNQPPSEECYYIIMNYRTFGSFPNTLRKYRKATGLNQCEVAKLIGLKSSGVIS